MKSEPSDTATAAPERESTLGVAPAPDAKPEVAPAREPTIELERNSTLDAEPTRERTPEPTAEPTRAPTLEPIAEPTPSSTAAPQREAAAARRARLAVCVATYMRPEGLERLLKALASASLPRSAPDIDVIVVDNDSEGSARAICDRARSWFPFELHYAIEKRRGIPQVRNSALALAMPFADFVVFTDDDVEPAPGWLAELLRVQALYRADVVAGPNPPRFLEPPPAWLIDGRFLSGQQRATGTLVDTAATCNALVRSEVLRQLDGWFDERFALHGSTDAELFRRIARAGHRMVWAQEAVAYECIPASRMTLRWLLLRAYRIASGRGSGELRALEGVAASWVFLNGLKCIARGAGHFALAVALRRGPVARAQALVKLASGAGWLAGLVGLRYREYARVHGK